MKFIKLFAKPQAARLTSSTDRVVTQDTDMPKADPHLDTLIIESVGAMVIVTDAAGNIVRFNRGGQRLMGYSEEEVLGKKLWDVFTAPEFRDRARRRFADLGAGEELVVEAVWITKSGERKHLTCTCIGSYGPDGKLAYTIGTGLDVTERVASEQRIRDSEARFRSAFEDAAVGMAVVNDKGQYLHVNRAFCDLTGYSLEELRKLDLYSITHPDFRDENRALFEDLINRKIPSYFLEKPYIRPDGQEVWVQVSAAVALSLPGQPTTVIGLFQNVSARKTAQDALAQANVTLEQRVRERTAELQARTEELDQSRQSFEKQSRILRSILDSIGDGVVVTDGTGELVLINPAAERMSGRTGNATIFERASRPIYFRADGTIIEPKDLPVIRSMRGESIDDEEVLIRRPGGKEFWASATSRPLLDQSGTPGGAVVVYRDVSERKRHQEELEAANASLRERENHYRQLADSHLRLAREVEHRVRNNLQGLLGLLSMMRDRATDVATFADALESRLAGMLHVHQLLAQVQWKGIDLRQLVDGALATLQHMTCHPTETRIAGPAVFIPPRQVLPLTLVIVEWFTNSCKYGAHSGPGGRLQITWEQLSEIVPRRVRLRWTEQAPSPLGTPNAPSLGTELVRGFVRRELQGSVDLRYPPTGADHLMEFSLREDGVVPGEIAGGEVV